MAECKTIKRPKRKICIGDLDTRVVINSRAISSPEGSGVDFGETFTLKQNAWALVESKRGETIFDNSNIAQDVTHYIYIRYISGITAEDWIDIGDQRLDIIETENLDFRNEFLLCRCTNKGLKTQPANYA